MEFNSVWVMGDKILGNLSRKTEDGKGIELVPFKITADEFYRLLTHRTSPVVNLSEEKLDKIIEKQG